MKNTLKNKNKNLKFKHSGFTLIELLAVIVILAIIALIATPIILGIVEDARKDSFMRSVELVVGTTDIDIFNKDFNDSYTYTITDGVVSNLEVGVKNTDGMNGSITYDKNGNDTYAIHNGKYCVIKTSDMDKAEIRDYVEDECVLVTPDNSFLTILTSKVSNENDTETYTNGQLINLGDYGIRYQGNDPDNYIYFNCEDYENQDEDTCEVWRIIGIVDGKVKLIPNVYEHGTWSTSADILTYLNEDYYEDGLTDSTKTLIDPSTWYLRTVEISGKTKLEIYDQERTTGEILDETPYIENVNLGLMYPSDYLFSISEECNFTNSYGSGCNSWMRTPTNDPDGIGEQTISPSVSRITTSSPYMIEITSFNGVLVSNVGSHDIRPVLYLDPELEIDSDNGNGTSSNPYRIIPN